MPLTVDIDAEVTLSEEILERAVRMFATGIGWDGQLRPPPGEAGCRASAETIAKHLPHPTRPNAGRAA